MATYPELKGLESNSDLQNLVEVAIWIAAADINAEDPPDANRLAWAAKALDNPSQFKAKFLRYLLAANSGLTEAQILAASESAVQAKVTEAVSIFVGS